MTAYQPSRSPCPIGRAARVIGDRWALLILREAMMGVETFAAFQRRLAIPRAALVSRLRGLVEAGVLARVPPEGVRARYELTEAGRDLFATMTALRQWGDRWLFDADHVPMAVPTRHGEPVAPVALQTPSGKRVTFEDRLIPGDG